MFQKANKGATWVDKKVESRPDGSELLAYYFETFFKHEDVISNRVVTPLHRNALNLIAGALQLKGWDK
jgi:hypothetical protein